MSLRKEYFLPFLSGNSLEQYFFFKTMRISLKVPLKMSLKNACFSKKSFKKIILKVHIFRYTQIEVFLTRESSRKRLEKSMFLRFVRLSEYILKIPLFYPENPWDVLNVIAQVFWSRSPKKLSFFDWDFILKNHIFRSESP